MINSSTETSPMSVAVIGMSGRFPGARDLDQFWANIRDGVESISRFSTRDLEASGLAPALLEDPFYVNANGVIEDIDLFDADFFGYNPREAEVMDPQHRLFLQCAWEALENAGYDPAQYSGAIGVYAGVSKSTYWANIEAHTEIVSLVGNLQVLIGNDKDHLTTRVAYKLNLTGPSITVQTTCSTSLVAVCLAYQSLLHYQCDMALAGGVSINIPQKVGYFYREGGIVSPDGHCRAFDARAQGTVGGNGLGIVVLKRLADALADGDTIHAIILGSAINNDGSLKVGYTAPSVKGQADVITLAQTIAGADPETITYVEAHGTGTPLGDPIEAAALMQAFRAGTNKNNFCALGSVKTNIGHLDAAAGIAGLIKTVLALKHALLPPSLHYEKANPQIDFSNSPFYVNNRLTQWPSGSTPRRAGVSSFGIGGTNAHVILEEPPPINEPGTSRPWQLLLLSARTRTGLETATVNLARHLRQHPQENLADVAHTLQTGRRAFGARRMLMCQDTASAVTALETLDPQWVFTNLDTLRSRQVVFMFPGQGEQYVRMGLEVYQIEPVFRETVDYCANILQPHLGLDLRQILYPAPGKDSIAAQQLEQTAVAQPALFVMEYALARLWMTWGVQPHAFIGHSLGEYVAACLAGVFSLEDALTLVAQRGRMMQSLPRGAMLAVPLSEEAVQPLLSETLSLAAVNSPTQCVVSGPIDGITQLQQLLVERGLLSSRLRTSHAFHSALTDPLIDPFIELVGQVSLHVPQVPFISNVTGTWITDAQAIDPIYWGQHLRQTVRFAAGVRELLRESDRILLEVGPGRSLTGLAQRHPSKLAEQLILASLRDPRSTKSDMAVLLSTLGNLWLAGITIDWSGFYQDEHRRRIPLPNYPFELKRYWIERARPQKATGSRPETPLKKNDVGDWLYVLSWKRTPQVGSTQSRKVPSAKARWLIFKDNYEFGDAVVAYLESAGHEVLVVTSGKAFASTGERTYEMNPHQREDYIFLLDALRDHNKIPDRIVHLWSLTPEVTLQSGPEFFEQCQDYGFYSLLFLTQALTNAHITSPLQINLVSNGIQDVSGEEVLYPEKATLLGICTVIPQEYPNITCRSIDLALPLTGTQSPQQLAVRLTEEFLAESQDTIVAYRGNTRWVRIYDQVRLPMVSAPGNGLREGGVYLITGGLGRIGLVLAEFLARHAHARLVLIGRSPFPEQCAWDEWLLTHESKDVVSNKIRKLQELITLGSEVLVASADVANLAEMERVIQHARERFGPLNGVIHAAGTTGQQTFSPIQDATRASSAQQFRPKAHGLFVLDALLQGEKLDFCLLVSSLSTVLGGLGFAAYAAANQFMDAFAARQNQLTTRWVSVNWDGWQLDELKAPSAAFLGNLAILPNEGADVIGRILACTLVPRVIVSTGDLLLRIRQWVLLEPLREAQEATAAENTSLYSRPGLPNSYVAPRTEVEQIITDACQELLGIDQIGIHDNFFDLGGHSLLAIQLIHRLRDIFQVELSVRSLFDTPTVAGLADYIQTMSDAAQVADKVAQALDLVEQLSDEEIRILLSDKDSGNGRG